MTYCDSYLRISTWGPGPDGGVFRTAAAVPPGCTATTAGDRPMSLRVPLPPLITPRMLGVDDFALYGDTHGTLLVDATTRLPLTLWKGRNAERRGRWLRDHPGVEVVSRDGARAYRQGVTGGAPDAVQVSDRFLLWQGLSRRVQDIASAHRGCLPAALPAIGDADSARVEDAVEKTTADTRAELHARRLVEAVQALTRSGRSHSSVARELGLNRRTVSKYARANTWHEVVRHPPRKVSTLDPYLDYLQQRWDEGLHSAKILHEELQIKGYLGHYQRVKMAFTPSGRAYPSTCHASDRPHHAMPPDGSRPIRAGAARTPTTALPHLLDHCPELKTAHDWSADSPPCSITATQPTCQSG